MFSFSPAVGQPARVTPMTVMLLMPKLHYLLAYIYFSLRYMYFCLNLTFPLNLFTDTYICISVSVSFALMQTNLAPLDNYDLYLSLLVFPLKGYSHVLNIPQNFPHF